jgi:potassium efflux system protein
MTAHSYAALTDAGVEIPLPQQVLQLRSVSPEAGAELASAGPHPAVDAAAK